MHMFIALASKAKDEKGEMYAGAGGGRRTNSSSTSSPTSEISGTDGGRRYVLHPRGWSQLCSADITLTYLLNK